MVELLLKHGADISSRSEVGCFKIAIAINFELFFNLFMLSSQHGSVPLHVVKSRVVAEILLRCGADPNEELVVSTTPYILLFLPLLTILYE